MSGSAPGGGGPRLCAESGAACLFALAGPVVCRAHPPRARPSGRGPPSPSRVVEMPSERIGLGNQEHKERSVKCQLFRVSRLIIFIMFPSL